MEQAIRKRLASLVFGEGRRDAARGSPPAGRETPDAGHCRRGYRRTGGGAARPGAGRAALVLAAASSATITGSRTELLAVPEKMLAEHGAVECAGRRGDGGGLLCPAPHRFGRQHGPASPDGPAARAPSQWGSGVRRRGREGGVTWLQLDWRRVEVQKSAGQAGPEPGPAAPPDGAMNTDPRWPENLLSPVIWNNSEVIFIA